MTTKTKIFSSTQVGAPILSGTAGSLIELLDAVLVNGWGAQAATSLVVAGGIATANFATAHAAQVDGVVLITGATPAALNGEKRVLTVAAQSLTFQATGVVDGTATGSISCKVAAAGWGKLFAGTNLAAYKSLAPESTGCAVQVADHQTQHACLTGYESMSSVSSGTGPFPSIAQSSFGVVWSKSSVADSSSRPWTMVADDRGFYFSSAPVPASPRATQTTYFGDIVSAKSNDAYGCVLLGSLTPRTQSTSGAVESVDYSDGTGDYKFVYMARAANTVGGSQVSYKESSVMGLTSYYSGRGSLPFSYPSATNNGLTLTKMRVVSSPHGLRGYLPGLYLSPQAIGTSLSTGDAVYGSGELAGAKLRVIGSGDGTVASSGAIFFDIQRSWR